MKIDCYLFDGCGAEQDLRKNIAQSLADEQLQAEVNFNIIDDKRLFLLDCLGHPLCLSMERSYSLRSQPGSLEECSAMSLEDSPMLPQ